MIYRTISGVFMMACFVAAVFFLKFWRRTTDKLFLYFSFSFFLLMIERILLGIFGSIQEPQPQIYIIRLCAFLLIIYAIIHKNKETNQS